MQRSKNYLEALQRLNNYLELEDHLIKFFNEQGSYCRNECKYHSCCSKDISIAFIQPSLEKLCEYASFYLLDKQRVSKYGKGKKYNSLGCRYNSKNGCKLKSHKPPVCIAYACDELSAHLKEKGYDYVRDAIHSILWDTLTDNLTQEEFNQKKFIIQGITSKK